MTKNSFVVEVTFKQWDLTLSYDEYIFKYFQFKIFSNVFPGTLKYRVGVQLGQSYFMGKRCLFSIGSPPFDGITIKIPYGVDILLHRPALHPSFPIGLVETESDFIIRSVETEVVR